MSPLLLSLGSTASQITRPHSLISQMEETVSSSYERYNSYSSPSTLRCDNNKQTSLKIDDCHIKNTEVIESPQDYRDGTGQPRISQECGKRRNIFSEAGLSSSMLDSHVIPETFKVNKKYLKIFIRR